MRDAGFIDNVLGESLGGTFDNADVVEEDINDIEYMGGRAALRWLPNENWTVDAGVVYQQMDANSYTEDNIQRSGRENAVVRFLDESREDEWTQLALTLQGDLGFGQFTSASSYFTRRIAYFQDNTDYTFYLSNAFGAYYANYDLGPDPRGLGWSDGPYVDRIAQEFRLQGSTEKMTWLAGLFYEKVEEGYSFFTRIEDYENTPSFDYWNTYYGVEPGTTDNVFYHSKNDQKTEQYAAFGEVGYSPNEDWTLHRGPALVRPHAHARLLHPAAERPLHHEPRARPRKSTSDITKKLSVQYNFTERRDGVRALLRRLPRRRPQRRASRHRRCRRITTRTSSTTTSSASRAAGWAAGSGSTSPLFQMEWDDYQVEVVDPGPLYAVLVANVGRRRDRGRQPRFHRAPVGLARLRHEPAAARRRRPSPTTRSSARWRAPGCHSPPRRKARLWLEYTFPGEFAGGNFYGRCQWSYNGNSLNGIDDDAVLQPAYQITDLKFGLAADEWEVYAYVDNADGRARGLCSTSRARRRATVSINYPRTWGLGFSKSWGGGN